MSAICSLWKIYKCLLHQIAFKTILLFVNNVQEKIITERQDRQFLKRPYTICNLHLCYMRMH